MITTIKELFDFIRKKKDGISQQVASLMVKLVTTYTTTTLNQLAKVYSKGKVNRRSILTATGSLYRVASILVSALKKGYQPNMPERKGNRFVDPTKIFVVHPDQQEWLMNYKPGQNMQELFKKRKEMLEKGQDYHNNLHDAEFRETVEEREHTIYRRKK